jgi:large subunit ribosomal protein L21
LTLGAFGIAVCPWPDAPASGVLSVPAEAPRVSTSDEESETAVYAIVRSGGQQQKVAVGDVIEIDKVTQQVGDSVSLPVVMLVDGETVTAGADKLGGASVTVEVLGATKGPKITILKYKNKTGYRKRQGHRQKYTQVKVTDISA